MRKIVFACFAALAVTPAAAADATHPTVIELFQSQGCSSCPPANAALIEFARRPEVLALNFSVDYWDRLGWKDTFAKPEFTQRQYAYSHALGEGVYTPQIVVNGRVAGVGDTVAEMQSLAQTTDRSGGVNLRIEANEAIVGAGKAPADGADVWLVAYDPKVVDVAVARGENSGRTLAHGAIVHGLVKLGQWRGVEARFSLPTQKPWSTAVLLQQSGAGPILAAARE